MRFRELLAYRHLGVQQNTLYRHFVSFSLLGRDSVDRCSGRSYLR
jgi:hypothetical protein